MPSLTGPVVPTGLLSSRPQPALQVDELTVRPWQESDAPDVEAAYSDPDIQRWHVQSMTADEARAWVLSRPARWTDELGADWAVTAGSRLVGRICVRTLDLFEGEGEVSYWVLPAGRGRRIAPRTLTAVTDWMFTEIGLHRMALRHSLENAPSCRVAEKAGFQLEGTMRQSGWHADGWHDMHLHARIAP